MNITKGDVQELRRRLKKTECTFGRLCGCYVNSGKQIVTKFTEQFPNWKRMNTTSTSRSRKDVQRHARRKPAGTGV